MALDEHRHMFHLCDPIFRACISLAYRTCRLEALCPLIAYCLHEKGCFHVQILRVERSQNSSVGVSQFGLHSYLQLKIVDVLLTVDVVTVGRIQDSLESSSSRVTFVVTAVHDMVSRGRKIQG